MDNRKIWGCGLPRSGGQTLQVCLQILYPSHVIYHSPGNRWSELDQHTNLLGAVEVFAPLTWLNENYPGSIYIYNRREIGSWLKSCASVYHQSDDWNHPLWLYPWSQFEHYHDDYYDTWCEFCGSLESGSLLFEIDLIHNPTWDELCAALALPIPDVPFPRVDRVKNPLGHAALPPPQPVWNFEV